MAGERRISYRNGVWIWDDNTNSLLYAKDLKDALHLQNSGSLSGSAQSHTAGAVVVSKFKETLGQMSQMNFRKFYQRKVKMNQKDVVTLQDIKDVTLYTYASNLSLEFVSYFHTKAMDNYLRSLIVYFQYYFQIWNKLQARRVEGARKLRQPVVDILENEIRDDLSDLRAMVARNYAVLMLGIGDAKQFHHMNNRNNVSLSDKDRRIFETFVIMSERVVYIALTRKYLSLIEKELNRMLRTDTFNPVIHGHHNPAYVATPEEERILLGKACAAECKLFQRSPVIQELILDQHDYRMLAIGVADMGQYDDRQNYLEIAYAAPEELLEPLGVPVGILGIPRKYFDATLKPRELSTTRRDSIMKPIPEFVIPKKKVFHEKICETLPEKRCQFQESNETKENRKRQCKMWREYIEHDGTLLAILMAPPEKDVSTVTLTLK